MIVQVRSFLIFMGGIIITSKFSSPLTGEDQGEGAKETTLLRL